MLIFELFLIWISSSFGVLIGLLLAYLFWRRDREYAAGLAKQLREEQPFNPKAWALWRALNGDDDKEAG